MASEVPPVLTEIILSGPEVVATERALDAVLEHYGVNASDATITTETDALDLLPGVHLRWQQQVVRLGSGSCGLTVDGLGLLVVSVPLLDVPVIVISLKSRLFDLSVGTEEPHDAALLQREKEMIIVLIARFEGRL